MSSSSSPSPSSSSHSSIHQASLVDASSHSPALLDLLQTSVSRHVVDYIVDSVTDVVHYAMGRSWSASARRSASKTSRSQAASFDSFVTRILDTSKTEMPVVLVALVYIHRARPFLKLAVDEWAYERVFLGALMLAHKYTNDVSLKNRHWAICTGVFGRRDVGRVEREFLEVLDYELSIRESDLLPHHAALMPPSSHCSARAPMTAHTATARSDTQTCHVPELDGHSESESEESEGPQTPDGDVDMFSPRPQPSKKADSHTHYSQSSMDLLHTFPLPNSLDSSSSCKPITAQDLPPSSSIWI